MRVKYNLKKFSRVIYFFSLGFFFVFSDQVLKFLAINFNFLSVSFNQGISFGFLPSNWWLIVNLIIIIAIFFIILIKGTGLGGLLILSGGLSNFVDRIWYGGVVDYIRIPLFPWVFNLADIEITLGILIIIYGYSLSFRPSSRNL